MDKNLIVEIFTPEKGGKGGKGRKGKVGTGYPVSHNLILTARHVLYPFAGRDEKHPIEIRWRHPKVEEGRWFPIREVVWERENLDLALLECDFPDGVRGWGFLSEQKPADSMSWSSVGFPQVSKTEKVRDPFPMQGSVFSMLDTDTRFQVASTAGPENQTDWAGASGSPVFVNWRMIGVIVSVPDNLKAARLKAVPIWRLLREDDEFRTLIGYDRHQDRYDKISGRMAAVLGVARETMACLARQLKIEEDFRKSQHKAEFLVGKLLQLEIGEIAKAFKAAYDEVKGYPAEAATLSAALNIVLPAVYDHGIVETVRNARGEVSASLVTLPVNYPTVAEIIMAGADRREALFCEREFEADFPKGKLCLPEPPEGGLDADGQQAITALSQHLTAKFCPAQAEEFEQAVDGFMVSCFYRTPAGAPERTWEQKVAGAAREIRYQAEEEGKTHYLIVNESENETDRPALENLLTRIRQRFPGLMCLSLQRLPEMEQEEFDCYRRLLGLLPIRQGG